MTRAKVKKRRRRFLRPIVLLALLLAILIWMWFEGILPRFGRDIDRFAGQQGEPEAPRGTAVAVPEAKTVSLEAPLTDAERGRHVRLEYLFDSGALEDAWQLATSMRGERAPDGRPVAEVWLGPKGRLAHAMVDRLVAAMTAVDLGSAERAAEVLRRCGLDEELARLGLLMTRDAGGLATALEELRTRIEPFLPIDLSARGPENGAELSGRRLERFEGESWIVRRLEPSGGFTFHPRSFGEFDPLLLRTALRARFSDDILELLDRAYRAAGRPLAARLASTGKLIP
ncbi:MAG: hypothetical protein KDC95_13640 [Planctomycetes bacterium]|nr:hypothetical protein [Planctomycetota bacterium]